MKPTDKMSRTMGMLALFGAAAPGGENVQINIQSGSSGAVSTYSLAAPAITRKGNGFGLVGGGITVTAATPGQIVTFQLSIGGNLLLQGRVTADANGLADWSAVFPGAFPAAPTVITITAHAASGNVTVAQQEAWVFATELAG